MSTSITIDFTDGYSFRKLIEYLKVWSKELTMVLTKDSISIEVYNKDTSVCNTIYIEKSELTKYIFNSPEEKFFISFDITSLLDIIKGAKKNSIRLAKRENKDDIYISLFKDDAGDSNNSTTIIPLNIDIPKSISYPVYERKLNNPNCTVSVSRFIEMCSRIVSIKPDNIRIKIFDKGITFVGFKTGNGATMFKFGDEDMVSKNSMLISPKIINSFKKINGMSNNSTIKIYAQNNFPVKLITHIGTYATISIYIRDNVSQQK